MRRGICLPGGRGRHSMESRSRIQEASPPILALKVPAKIAYRQHNSVYVRRRHRNRGNPHRIKAHCQSSKQTPLRSKILVLQMQKLLLMWQKRRQSSLRKYLTHPKIFLHNEQITWSQHSNYLGVRYTLTNTRAPLTVQPLEALAPRKGDGTPTGTEVTPLTQHPITKLPLANAGKEHGSHNFSQHNTISCYPIGQAVRSPEALIG
ncbi:hypothetical protein TNCV_1536061 [Trichonephila clavipes]|nr:hypothetical protein TNCV_1536061 [Trichonephila clavipes]